MQQHEALAFSDLIAGAWEAVGRNLTGRAVVIMFESLKSHSLEAVQKAVSLHSRGSRGRNPPTVADIEEIIGDHTSTIGADEAWGLAVQAADERNSVVWTQPIAQAWGLAQPIYRAGDEVGARMAFRAHYERAVAACREQGIQPVWFISQGNDPVLLGAVVESNIQAGRLPNSAATVFALPAPSQGIAGLIESAARQVSTGEDTDTARENALNALSVMRKFLSQEVDIETGFRLRQEARNLFDSHRQKKLGCLAEFAEIRGESL